MLKKLIVISLVITGISCKSYQDPSTENMTIIHQSELTGNGEEGINGSYHVIENQEDWNALEEKMNSINDQRIKMDPVNFKNEMIIALFSEVKNSGGHSIKIKEITQKDNQVIIKVEETSPRGLATSMMTQPYYIAKIPKTDKLIEFKTTDRIHK
ncbi:MAG: protease complex subunit PrcB family protein [Psychroflexus halocasei]